MDLVYYSTMNILYMSNYYECKRETTKESNPRLINYSYSL